MRLSEYASTRKTRGSYKMPRSVQQSIPIDRIYADGVWQSENVFSLMWQISDINYAMQSDAAKQNILMQLGTVYAGIPADCWMQVCIVSQRMDEKAFARDVLYHRENDGFDALRAERNRQIKANARENGNVVQHKYIIVSTNKPGVKEARERFVQVQGHLLSAFSALECAVTPLDNRARLEVLHKFFRISEEGRFNFEFDNCAKLGQDFRDSIAPDCIRFCKKHIEIEDFYAKCMTISEYPQQLDDKFISALLQQVPYIVLSIDIEPVETEDAFKEIDSAQMKTDAEKVRFNKKSVENLDFTSSVPQRTQEQDRIIANIRKEMTENDQQMFLSLLTVTYFADTLEDLALETDALKTTAANYNCRFTELYFQQERAFNTAMPYGLRRIESVRTMLTKSLTALVPFNTQEILTPGGICYGRNAVTGNLIIGLRTTLVNGNAMVVATSGGGKSMFVKLEILMLYLRFTKARFYIVDPENEYAPLVQELGGEVVNISVDSSTYFNPLDFKPDKSTDIPPYVAKAEFVLSLCEQIMKKENVLPGDRSLIDRALRSIYKPLIESKYTAPCPTIKDLWSALNSQGDNRSKELALALEIFATGSMQVFAQPTNVDMSNRLICFNIQSLGEQLKPVAMLSMLEYINTAVMSNERNDPKAATWVYFDEIYLLLRDSLSSNFLYTSWKRFRKYNAYATGITQNVQDCLTNDTAYVRRGGIIECDNVTDHATAEDAAEENAATEETAQSQESNDPDDYTEEELAAIELPATPENVAYPKYSDNLHHYYGSVGISEQKEQGGDRLHFVMDQSKPEDARLVPANLYMNELVNRGTAELQAYATTTPLTGKQLAAFVWRLNKQVAAIGTEGVPEAYGKQGAQIVLPDLSHLPMGDRCHRNGGQTGEQIDFQHSAIHQHKNDDPQHPHGNANDRGLEPQAQKRP